MAKKTISNETLKQWLDIFFPFGYGKSSKDEDAECQIYIGWLKMGTASITSHPCEINLESGGSAIVFQWWVSDEYTDNEVAAYLEGVMSQLAPDMVRTTLEDGQSLVMFEYKDE